MMPCSRPVSEPSASGQPVPITVSLGLGYHEGHGSQQLQWVGGGSFCLAPMLVPMFSEWATGLFLVSGPQPWVWGFTYLPVLWEVL